MTSVGSFGKKRVKHALTFKFFDETYRVNPAASEAAMIEFLAEAGSVDQADEVRGAIVIMSMMRNIVHPDEFDKFWKVAKEEQQSPGEDLMPIAHAILEKLSTFQSGGSSDSVSGQVSMPPKSVTDVELPMLTPETLRAIELTHGRPDLQLAMPKVADYVKN